VTVQWDIQDIILFIRKVRFRATSFRKIQWVELSPAIFSFYQRRFRISRMSIFHELKMIPLHNVYLRKKMSGSDEMSCIYKWPAALRKRETALIDLSRRSE